METVDLKQHCVITVYLALLFAHADKMSYLASVCCLLLLAGSSGEEDEQDRGNPGMWGRLTPSDNQ